MGSRSAYVLFFFFNDTATTEIYTLSLHDALPIWRPPAPLRGRQPGRRLEVTPVLPQPRAARSRRRPGRRAQRSQRPRSRSEEHTSELQSPDHLVCRLLLEKKKTSEPATYVSIAMR